MDRLTGLIAAGLVTLDLAGPAQAQWQAFSDDNGAIFYAGAGPQGQSFLMGCANRAQQGLGLMETGSHETTLSAPGTLFVNFGMDLVGIPPNDWRRSDVVIWADGTGYRLPQVRWNELNANGWEGAIGIADPLVLSLLNASAIVIGAEAGPHYQLDATDMGPRLADTLRFCLSEYQRMGQSVPPALAPLMASAPAAPVPQAGTFEIPPQVVASVTAQACNGGSVSVSPSAYQAGDLDGDTLPDVVVNYGDVTCPNERFNPNCGAANCSHEVYVSTRGYLRPFEMLGTGLTIVPHRAGGLALQLNGTFSICGEGACATPWRWTGTTFEQIP